MLWLITLLLVIFLIIGIITTIYFFGIIPNTEPYFTKQVEDTLFKISTITQCEDIFKVIDDIKTKIKDNKTFREWVRYGVAVDELVVIDPEEDDKYIGLPVGKNVVDIIKEKFNKCIKDSRVIEHCKKCKKCREDQDNEEDVTKNCGEYCSECKLDTIRIKKPKKEQVKKDICAICRRCKNRGYSEKTCKAMCADCKEKKAIEKTEKFINFSGMNPYYQVNM